MAPTARPPSVSRATNGNFNATKNSSERRSDRKNHGASTPDSNPSKR